MTNYDKNEAYPLGFIKNFQWNTGRLWWTHVWLKDSHFSFPSWEMLTPAPVSLLPLNFHFCTESEKNADVTSLLLYWINRIGKRGKLLKFGNEETPLSSKVEKDNWKSPNNLKEIGKYAQDSIHQFDKNTVSYSAWNVVILSEILDKNYSE